MLEYQVIFAHTGIHKLLQEHTLAACHVGSYCNAKSWNWLKSTAIFYPSLPLEVEVFNGLQSSEIVKSEDSVNAIVA